MLIAQEERCDQRVYVQYFKKKNTWLATCAPSHKGFFNYRSKSPVRLVTDKNMSTLDMTLPRVSVPIPAVIIMRALGFCSDKEFMEMVCYDLSDLHLMELIRPSILAADEYMVKFLKSKNSTSKTAMQAVRQQDNALAYIGSKMTNNVKPDEECGRDVLNLMFHHIGQGYKQKAYFLGYMIRQICLARLGRCPEDDKEHYKNKRLDLAGQLLRHQFRAAMAHLQRDMQKQLQKHLGKEDSLGSIKTFVQESIITKNLQGAFTLGNWNTSEGQRSSGVVGDIKRTNTIAMISHLRQLRLNLPPKSRPTESARHPNFSYWARVCPVQTTDGDDCGLVKNISLTGILSSNTEEEPLMAILLDHGMRYLEEILPSSLADTDKVFLNGKWVGTLDNSQDLVNILRAHRRKGAVHEETEVVKDDHLKEVRIYTDGGRILRPLLVVQNQCLVLSKRHLKKINMDMKTGKTAKECWQALLADGVVEYLGVEEEEGAMVALGSDDLAKARGCDGALVYSHCEIDSSYLMGLGASTIPFLEHNQASRNLFQSDKHCKQAIGLYTTNFQSRADASASHLFYPQKPLVTTRAASILQKPELYSGQTVIVAILCYGYNQEDSIVMNQASVDRGLFRSAHYKTYKGEEKKNIQEQFSKPSTSDVKGWYNKSLDKVEGDGFPCLGEKLVKGDIVIGKVTSEVHNPRQVDSSTHLKVHQKGHVDQVMLSSEEDGHRIAKVRLRVTRAPQAGDKFSSMHGQKGVIGALFPQEDLPFTQQGIVPDIIMNPHALPSRQTVGQILECLLGKAIAASGKRRYAIPFSGIDNAEAINQYLHEAKLARGGCEFMSNGTTGQRLKVLVTIGPTFYQRLEHMAEDKIKYRGNTGPVNLLTRQPVKDRNSLGGLKFGEMERDCMLGHGASATLRERYFLLSDPYKMYICQSCRRPATMDSSRIPKCQFCKNGKRIVQVQIPYACKLLWQELLSMGICVYMDTKKC